MDDASWRCRQLTHGTTQGLFHAHAYYDIPVFDSSSRYLVAHQVQFAGRHPTPSDKITIGVVDTQDDDRWRAIGTTSAWSWQQGALSQWLPGRSRCVWNERRSDGFGARIHDIATGDQAELPVPVYAVAPNGRFALSLDMARLDTLRPGYGYACAVRPPLRACPEDEGVRRVDLDTGAVRTVLSLRRAARFLSSRLGIKGRLKHLLKGYSYWFNHAKIAPNGERFTVKLRFRKKGEGWNERQGVSLTCGVDGRDLALLADATSHVIWLDDERLYFYRRDGVYLSHDRIPEGAIAERLFPHLIAHNVHIRHMPSDGDRFVFDTPYREEIDLLLHHCISGRTRTIAQFQGHTPKRGPFRCDLHPAPSPDGRKIAVSSLQDGGRQLYLLEAE